jgi:hypothetical protein
MFETTNQFHIITPHIVMEGVSWSFYAAYLDYIIPWMDIKGRKINPDH